MQDLADLQMTPFNLALWTMSEVSGSVGIFRGALLQNSSDTVIVKDESHFDDMNISHNIEIMSNAFARLVS